MIVVSLLLILVAVTLLAVGLAVGSSPLLISSIVASLLAAVALVVGARQAATQRRRPVVTERPATRLAPSPPIHRGAGRRDPAAAAAFTDEADARSGNSHSDLSGSDPISADNGDSPHAEPDAASARHSPGVEPEPAEPDADLRDGRPASAAHPGANGPAADRAADDDSEDRFSEVGATEPLSEADARAAGRHDVEAALAGDPAVEHVQSTGDSPENSGVGEPDEDDPADEPPPQAVRPGDAVSVARMDAEVLVVDGRPRYHLADCPHLVNRRTEPLPANEAVELGFSPCGRCRPVDRLVAEAAHR